MNPVQTINRFFLLTTAPFLGILLCFLFLDISVTLPHYEKQAVVSNPIQTDTTHSVQQKLELAHNDASSVKSTIEKIYQSYNKSTAQITTMLQTARAQTAVPMTIYDQRVTAKLGTPIKQASSGNIDMKLYALYEPHYRGYAMKVNLKSDKAMRMVLGKDKIGNSETTLEAVRRYGAIAGVNAGGFADDSRTGKRFPLSTTMIGGKYVYGFEPSFDDLTFVGLNTSRKLIGGKFYRQEELDRLNPSFGATFVPTLLLNGKKQIIPSQWLTNPTRAPRTVVGNYKNDQLLFLVTDGFDERGNSGASLPELQEKLISLGVVDAYNLDGGGSSTLIFDGQVINTPSDGKLRPLATHFLFFK